MKIKFYKSYIELVVQNNIYSIDVIHKCFYWYLDSFNIDISSDGNLNKIKLYPKEADYLSGRKDELVPKIRQDLFDYKLRDIITKETLNIRELIIAKAFANSDEFDNLPPGNQDELLLNT